MGRHELPGEGPEETRVLRLPEGQRGEAREVLLHVHRALQEKGYDPIRQIAHYLLTGEPAYITAHRNARALIGRVERDQILEELVRFYLAHNEPGA